MTITTTEVSYSDGNRQLTGVLAADDASRGERPGLLLIHGGGGLDDHARAQARRYAALGYVVFACDMFGEGVIGDRERVVATLTGLRDDPDRLVARAGAGLRVLRESPSVGGRFGAVGFCFGGMTALTLARSGADLAGVVSMHGALKTARPAQPRAVKAALLACHGALDPHVPMSDVVAFIEEMDRAVVDYQVIVYGGAMHGFTHEHAVAGAFPGVAYHEPTDRRSFQAASDFLRETLSD